IINNPILTDERNIKTRIFLSNQKTTYPCYLLEGDAIQTTVQDLSGCDFYSNNKQISTRGFS
ncbi:hypothetical protein CEN39_24715, partial [Fischerella thermalis CCMEE 5201]